MKKTLKLLSIALCICVIASVFAGCKPVDLTANSGTETDVKNGLYVDGKKVNIENVMSIDGTNIPFDLYRYYYNSTKAQIEYSNATIWDGEEAEDAEDYVKGYALSMSQSYVAIQQWAAENNISLTADELKTIDEQFDATLTQIGDETAQNEALSASFFTKETYKIFITQNALIVKIIDTLYGEELLADIKENYVHAQHILISFPTAEEPAEGEEPATPDYTEQKEKIEGILARAKSGEDFLALMKEFNEDPGETDDGYHFTKGQMVEPFETAAFALKDGEISEVVETSYGYHILKRLPLDEEYIKTNKMSMISSEFSAKLDETIAAYLDKQVITYDKNYDKIAHDTMF